LSENINNPVSFGYKMGWLAVRSCRQTDLLQAMKLNNKELTNWQDGIKKAYSHNSELEPDFPVFISPPVNGWIFLVSPLFLTDTPENATSIKNLLNYLSETFEEAQAFGTHRTVKLSQWMLSRNGSSLRTFVYLGKTGEILIDEGELTDIEKHFKFSAIKESQWIPDEETVLSVASAWSLNPVNLEEKTSTGSGYIASLSNIELNNILKNYNNRIKRVFPDSKDSKFHKIDKKTYLIRHYQRKLNANIMGSYAYLNLGLVYLLTNNLELSINNIKQALKLDRRNYYAYQALIDIYEKYPEIEINIDHYSKTGPENIKVLYELYYSAVNYYLQDNNLDAITRLEKAKIIDPQNPYNYYLLTEIYFEKLQLSKAKSNAEKLLSYSLDEASYDLFASIALLRGESELVRETVENIAVINPESALYYSSKATLHFTDGNHPAAIESFKKAIDINPDNEEVYAGLGHLYINLGDNEEGLKHLNKSLEIDSGNFTANITFAYYHFINNQFAEAIKYAEKALYYQPYNPLSFILLGRSYLENKDIEKAIDCFDEALKFNTNKDDVYAYLSYAYFNKKDFSKAKEYLKEAIAINPKHPFVVRMKQIMLISNITKIALLLLVIIAITIIVVYFT